MIYFELEGIEELEREFDRAYSSTLAGEMRRAVNVAVDAGVSEAKSAHRYKDQSGDLTRSIHAIRDLEASVARAEFSGAIAADEKYASFVEDGTKAHEIHAKASRALIGPLPKGQSRSRRKGVSGLLKWQGPDGRWYSKAVVHHPGTRPLPFMGIAYQKAERVLEAELEVALDRFAAEVNRAR